MGRGFIAAAQGDTVEPPHPAFAPGATPRPPLPRRLRIFTYLYSFAPGGVERVAARLHTAWRAHGMEAQILLANADIAPPQPLNAVRQVRARAAHGHLAGFVALVRALPQLTGSERPDILFCAGNTYTLLAVVLRLMLGRSCPPIVAKISNCLVRPDMPLPLRWLYRRWLRVQGRHIDHFVALAPAMRAEIVERMGVPAERISVIRDPALCMADIARLAVARDAVQRDRPGRHYLAVGRLAPQKNFALLLDAFARARGPGDTLTILGEGSDRAMLERRAAALGIGDALLMPGHTDPLDPWLAAADVFVLSSTYEGVPAVLIEALAAGVPIVATDCCVSMRDLLGHGTLGRIVPKDDPAALAQAMAAIALDAPQTVAAARTAAAGFTIEHAAGAYLDVMRALAATRGVSASHGQPLASG